MHSKHDAIISGANGDAIWGRTKCSLVSTSSKLFIVSANTVQREHYYEWAKRTKFLLTVIYGATRRHSNSSKTFLKNIEKIEIKLYDHFRTETFKTMNRHDPTRLDRNALWHIISQKVWKIGTWNFNTIFSQLFNLYYQILKLISLIVWTLGFSAR